ncbi:MAG TPA: UDP-3-O-acyl-N-acetylglucosamine deacetylase [Thermoanaerobaculaceae bacterium]|nr:UDP-3-O-acyl-N-acetylglucosamine deacetylase [Thermoanaerobaculaceae bacterium]
MARQTTVRRTVEVVGISRVYQRPSRLRFRPAAPGTGIAFHRTDRGACVAARLDLATAREGRLVLGRSPCQVEGAEHLLAAVVAQGLTDLFIDLDGSEPPAFDGGATVFCEMLAEAGIAAGRAFVPALQVLAPCRVESEAGTVELRPSGELLIEARTGGREGGQRVRLRVTSRSVASELAPARCPDWSGPSQDQQALRGAGARARRTWSQAGELHRHRTLELLGCLALLGQPLHAEIVVDSPSLELALGAFRQMLAQKGSWELSVPGQPVPLWNARRGVELDGIAAGLG